MILNFSRKCISIVEDVSFCVEIKSVPSALDKFKSSLKWILDINDVSSPISEKSRA